MLRALSVMSVRVLFWLRLRCRRSFLLSLASLRRAIFSLCGGGAPPLLYALLTRFRAPTPPSMLFAAARPSMGRTERLASVFACCGVLSCAGGAIAAAISLA